MESKVRHVGVVNLYTFITQNYTQFALKIVILLFKFVQSFQEFCYYIKMHFSSVQSHSCTVRYKATLAQFGTKALLHSSVQSLSCTVRYKGTLAQFGTKPLLHSSVQSHSCTVRYKAILAQFHSLHCISFPPILITVNCRLSSSLWPSCSLAPTYYAKHNLPEPAKSATRA